MSVFDFVRVPPEEDKAKSACGERDDDVRFDEEDVPQYCNLKDEADQQDRRTRQMCQHKIARSRGKNVCAHLRPVGTVFHCRSESGSGDGAGDSVSDRRGGDEGSELELTFGSGDSPICSRTKQKSARDLRELKDMQHGLTFCTR